MLTFPRILVLTTARSTRVPLTDVTNASANTSLESGGDVKRQKVDGGHGLTNAQNNLLQNNLAS